MNKPLGLDKKRDLAVCGDMYGYRSYLIATSFTGINNSKVIGSSRSYSK